MDRKFITTLALRLLGIYVLLQALYPLGFFLANIAEKLGGRAAPLGDIIEWVAMCAGFLIAGAVLLRWAPSIATRIVGAESDTIASPSPAQDAIEIVGYRFLGVYAIVISLPSLLSNLAGEVFGIPGWPAGLLTREMLTALFGTAIGVWLLLGARGLAGFVARMRAASVADIERRAQRPSEHT